ncbi:MAG TPA: ASCH domain-containing protein [Pyrinomonadaceae bacterium]|nr:ASCH domain-containing protein [Pyrinomonadaceae bacterium]
MKSRESANELWRVFCAFSGTDPKLPFQVWHFGNTPEMAADLGKLVVAGLKTATASLVEANAKRPDEKPVLDGFSVVTDLDHKAICVVRTTEIRFLRFEDVDAQFAFDEGEGDRSYEYWRDVHWEYFSNEARELGLEFCERSLICCERFEVLFVNEL